MSWLEPSLLLSQWQHRHAKGQRPPTAQPRKGEEAREQPQAKRLLTLRQRSPRLPQIEPKLVGKNNVHKFVKTMASQLFSSS